MKDSLKRLGLDLTNFCNNIKRMCYGDNESKIFGTTPCGV